MRGWILALAFACGDVLLAVPGAVADDGAVKLPDGTELVEVDFERHVAGLFSRLGCNAAACHGSFQGKGGFRLSLFGQSSEMDHAAVLGAGGTSRVAIDTPDNSAILAKPAKPMMRLKLAARMTKIPTWIAMA